MSEFVMSVANNPSTPWWVLIGVGLIVAVEAFRSGPAPLWGDMFDDPLDE